MLRTCAFVAAVFLLLGTVVVVRWWRHYRRILGQADIIDQRVASEEPTQFIEAESTPQVEQLRR